MNPRPDQSARRPNWLRFSLRTLLLLMLLISAYLGGRMPATRQLQQAEQELARLKLEREEAERLAALTQQRLNAIRVRFAVPKQRNRQSIDAGMMLDALDHQQRYAPPTFLDPLP